MIIVIVIGESILSELEFESIVLQALAEDIGSGDVTTNAMVPEAARCKARLIAKQDGILSGIDVFATVFECLDGDVSDWNSISDGSAFTKGQTLATFTANTRATLTGERTALNFLQHLTGIATQTAAYAALLEGTAARVCDTRKTTPLLRTMEKQAVIDGGGSNHRFGLSDGVLIKENHIEAAGGIAAAIKGARSAVHHLLKIEVEVKNLDELREALEAHADVIMLDNMSLEDMREAVGIAQGSGVLLEASGNVTLERIRAIAETGVDLISVGALTHSAAAADVSLLIETLGD